MSRCGSGKTALNRFVPEAKPSEEGIAFSVMDMANPLTGLC